MRTKKVVTSVVVVPLQVGNKVFIRTVTNYYVGKVEAVDQMFVHLSSVAWVADTGRFANALKTGDLSEVEVYPDGIVSVGITTIVDVSIWNHELCV